MSTPPCRSSPLRPYGSRCAPHTDRVGRTGDLPPPGGAHYRERLGQDRPGRPHPAGVLSSPVSLRGAPVTRGVLTECLPYLTVGSAPRGRMPSPAGVG